MDEHEEKVDAEVGEDAARSALVEKLENKKTELVILHLFEMIYVQRHQIKYSELSS